MVGRVLVAAAVWNSWWRDALLSGPAHVVDIMVFTLLMFGTHGYTSPFFLSFVFILLAAAIRRGWRETAMTAAALIALYVTAGAIAGAGDEQFEWQRFIIRGGHLIILSAILIWFGVNQGVGDRALGGRVRCPTPRSTNRRCRWLSTAACSRSMPGRRCWCGTPTTATR